MKKSSEIIEDLLRAGFGFRPTKHHKNAVEIMYCGRWWRMYNRKERMMIMPTIRTCLRNIGYNASDLEGVRDAIVAFAHKDTKELEDQLNKFVGDFIKENGEDKFEEILIQLGFELIKDDTEEKIYQHPTEKCNTILICNGIIKSPGSRPVVIASVIE